jgi:hypothetical protein
MSYKSLTAQKIYTGEVPYTLNDFTRDFRKRLEADWGERRLDKDHKGKTLYQGLLLIVVFASQHKPLKLICEVVMGKSSDETQEITKDILDMYEQEIEVLEGIQMKMFLDNLQKFCVSESLNLKLLNANIRNWLGKALDLKD